MGAGVRKMGKVVPKRILQSTKDVKMEPDGIKEPRNATQESFTYLKIEKEY
jgi:hypothetical protein